MMIELGDAIFPSTSMFFIDVTSADDYDGNNSVSETMNLTSEIATSLVRVRFTTDNMPGDNRWDITDGAGDVVASTAFGDMTEKPDGVRMVGQLGRNRLLQFHGLRPARKRRQH